MPPSRPPKRKLLLLRVIEDKAYDRRPHIRDDKIINAGSVILSAKPMEDGV
jgi:hypothetical protein